MSGMHRWAIALVLAFFCVLGGCSKKITVIQFPEFYTPELKTIAVVPFTNATNNRGAGSVLTDAVASGMRANGTYKVFNRNELEALLSERDRQIAFGNDPKAAADKFAGMNVQAILVGTVNTYDSSTNSDRRQEPQYIYDKYGNQQFAGNRVYTYTRNEGHVSVSLSLLRVPGGVPIHSTAAPAQGDAADEGSPPQLDRTACLSAATQVAVARAVEEFCVVRKTIEVKEKDALLVASERVDGKWQETSEFSSGETSMFVVVNLPPAADRNRFRIVIVPKDSREVVARMDITWSRNFPERGEGFQFSPSEIAAKAGAGDYTVKLYAGEEPVLMRDFQITKKK